MRSKRIYHDTECEIWIMWDPKIGVFKPKQPLLGPKMAPYRLRNTRNNFIWCWDMIPAQKKWSRIVIERISIFAPNLPRIGPWDENSDEKWGFGATRQQLYRVFVAVAIGEVLVREWKRFLGSSIAISRFSIFQIFALFGALSCNFPQFWVAHNISVITPKRMIPNLFLQILDKVWGPKGFTRIRNAKYG